MPSYDENNRSSRTREEQEILERRRAMREARAAKKKKQQQQSLMILAGFFIILIILIVVILKGCSRSGADKDSSSKAESTDVSSPLVLEPETENNDGSDASGDSAQASVPESEEETSEESSETPQPVAESDSSEESSEEEGQIGASTTWDLDTLDNTEYNFGYTQARDDRNVPTDWAYYERLWGEFNVDWIGDTEQNIIYLTMDEGFPNEYTDTILDILEEKDVKATFFLTKMFLDGGESSYAQIRRMIELGCVLGNHTCTHPAMPELSIEEQTEEIMGVHNIVKDEFDYDLKLFRFPQGKYSAQSLGLVDNLGYKTCFWSYAYNDYSDEQPPVQESYEKAVAALHPGAIYLLHANSSTNTAFLADWIDAARAAGFEFGVYPLTAN